MHNFVTKTITKQKSNIKTSPEPEIEPGTCTQSGCVTSAPPIQLRVAIMDKIFNST